jgi:hypothetical protein
MQLSPIKLIFGEQHQYRGKVELCIENISREIDFNLDIDGINIRIKSSVCPEWDSDNPNILFLQGSDKENENSSVILPKKNLKYFLFAIWKYNIKLPEYILLEDLEWINKYQFKCKHCNVVQSITQFDQENFEYCLDCKVKLKTCYNCDRLNAQHLFGEQYYCDNCVVKNSFCQNCETEYTITRGCEYSIPNNFHGPDVLIGLCTNCWGKDILFGEENHYHYTPEFLFRDYDYKKKQYEVQTEARNNKLYMGMEIEAQFKPAEHTNIVIGRLLKFYNKQEKEILYAKHDGTVPDPGSELVTHPMTLNMFRHIEWQTLFDNIKRPSNDEIGGHIHINKNAFVSPLHVYKFCNFLRTNIEYVEWVAERSLQEWCKANSRDGKIVQLAKRFKRVENTDRYEMVNFTKNTIELRFFKSPFTISMLLKNVEFVDALYNYTRDVTLQFSYQNFEEYTDKNSIKYPYLYNFILKRKAYTFCKNAERFRQGVSYDNTVSRSDYSFTNSVVNEEITSEENAPDPVEGTCVYCNELVYEDEAYEYHEDNLYHDSCFADRIAHASLDEEGEI